jgi:two-component system, NtrC family, response regulator AtoC
VTPSPGPRAPAEAVVALAVVTSGIPGTTGSVHHVLLVGPDDDARRALHVLLDRVGKQVAAVAELAGARGYLDDGPPCDAVIAAGELAAELVRGGAPPVIAVIRPRDLAVAAGLFEAGVAEVVGEPVDELAVTLALRHVAALPRRTGSIAAPALIGDGAVMQRLRATIDQVAPTRSTVLILGESGTGKELVARAIHDASPRRGHRFVAVNCAAIPGALLESELFGHRRGAFTDAVRDKRGLFEDADGGTLLLDEVGELPLALQAKLLRALQEGEIRRVGDTASIQVDVRLIAATLRDLADDVREGRFREDLYYRLHVLPVEIPPLRERVEDIPQLARFFARRHAARHQLAEIELSDAALDALARRPWPGNVRELENVLERAVVLAEGPTAGGGPRVIDASAVGGAPARALEHTAGNRTNAAKLLEISHRALLYKMKEYGIS